MAVKADVTVAAGHDIAENARRAILRQLDFISNVVTHVDPLDSSGEAYHRSEGHTAKPTDSPSKGCNADSAQLHQPKNQEEEVCFTSAIRLSNFENPGEESN